MGEPTAHGSEGRDEGGGAEEPPASGGTPPADRPRAVPHVLRPIDGLEYLERQWVTALTLADWHGSLATLALTVDEDPFGFDYLGALIGAPAREVAATYAAWLQAQLAADALRLGRAVRPRVELVPVGRLWYVVRNVPHVLAVLDGPGYPSPRAALRAARLRYRAMLEAEIREGAEAADPGPAEASDHGDADEATTGATPDPDAPAGAPS
jgi:hypothetical protein